MFPPLHTLTQTVLSKLPLLRPRVAHRSLPRSSKVWTFGKGRRLGLGLGLGLKLGLGLVLQTLPATAQSNLDSCTGANLLASATPADIETLNQTLVDIPYATGLYWQATREDRVIDLIGTLHLNDPRFAPWMPTLTRDLQTAQLLLVEANPEDLSTLQRSLSTDPSLIFIQSGPSLIDRLSPAQWKQVKDAVQKAGLSPLIAAKMKPWFLAISLAVPPCLRNAPQATHGLDMRLMDSAETAGIPIHSLEDPMSVYTMLDAEPLDKQVADLSTYLHLLSSNLDDLHTLKDGYFAQNVQRVVTFQEQQFFASLDASQARTAAEDLTDLNTQLITGRNRAWMDVIQDAQADHLMIAVGAAHLPGETGLLSLLEEQGYTLRRKTLP